MADVSLQLKLLDDVPAHAQRREEVVKISHSPY
jgi:hypothetical protein